MVLANGDTQKNWRRPTLRLILSVVMVGLVLAVAASLIAIGFVRARQTAVERVQERMNDFSDRLTGRLSMISTVSPRCDSFFSSWA